MAELVRPHGGEDLKPLLAPPEEQAEGIAQAASLKKIGLSSREVSDLFMLGMGAYTPLDGFMGEADWRGVCVDLKLANGVFWPIPITMSASKSVADSISVGDRVALTDGGSGEVLGLLDVTEKYQIDKALECENVFRTIDESHPGVQKVMQQGEFNIAGPVVALSEGHFPVTYRQLYLRPEQSREAFKEQGWSRIAAFQTRNPMHRSHEYLAKIAVEVTDGVFIHQVLGALKPGDIPADVRTNAIQAMIDNYFVLNTVIQAGYPIEMRYGGPREALLHALIRQNFGCSHLIVGRDHAGVGDYYGPYDAQDIFDELWDGALQTVPLKIGITFFCNKCDGMATEKTCPHGAEDRTTISGTRQREMLTNGEDIPTEFSRPEVVAVIRDYYSKL